MYMKQGSKGDIEVTNRLLDSVGEDESGMIGENGTETCTQPSLWPNSHICTWLQEKPKL